MIVATETPKKVLLLGGHGFVSKNFIKALGKNLQITALVRESVNTSASTYKNNENISYLSYKEMLSSFEVEDFDVIINATRINLKKLEQAVQPDLNSMVTSVIKNYSSSKTCVINLGTYIQYYEISTNAANYTYALSKRQISSELKYLQEKIGFSYFEITLFTLYGPEDAQDRLCHLLIHAAKMKKTIQLSGGDQLLSLTNVEDVIKLIEVIILNQKHIRSGIYSFWPEPPITLKEVVRDLNLVCNNSLNVIWSSSRYSGHELFNYETEVFPPQIQENFTFQSFTSFFAKEYDSLD